MINIDKQYVCQKENFEFIEGVFETCRFFASKDYLIIVVTNQSGIALGYYTDREFHELTTWMLERFKTEGIKITKVYYCPHHVGFTHECDCRKPEPGMILQAQEEYQIDLSQSILVGDKITDIQAGLAAGVGKNYLIVDKDSFITDLSCQKVEALKSVPQYL